MPGKICCLQDFSLDPPGKGSTEDKRCNIFYPYILLPLAQYWERGTGGEGRSCYAKVACIIERKRRMAFECNWQTRDSVTPSMRLISFKVKPSV